MGHVVSHCHIALSQRCRMKSRMNVPPRSLGAAVAIVGLALWIIAVVVDASLVAVIVPVLMVMGGGALMAWGDGSRDGSPHA